MNLQTRPKMAKNMTKNEQNGQNWTKKLGVWPRKWPKIMKKMDQNSAEDSQMAKKNEFALKSVANECGIHGNDEGCQRLVFGYLGSVCDRQWPKSGGRG